MPEGIWTFAGVAVRRTQPRLVVSATEVPAPVICSRRPVRVNRTTAVGCDLKRYAMSHSCPWVATVWFTQSVGCSATGLKGPHAIPLRSSSESPASSGSRYAFDR